MTKSVTSLDDKYLQESGRVFISANQALVRLPLEQARRDRARGLHTTGYISGYRGSPLGVYDAALWGAQKLLDQHHVRFQAGLNEELAATAVRGTQQLDWFGKSEYQGAFGLWYGKGLGVDRACEALKLGNLEGSAANGGVLAVAGDDHGGKSSASAHQSEHTLIAGFLPTLYPSTIQEILSFGIFGWELSRYSGLYVGLKCITDTLDLASSVELPDIHRTFARPSDIVLPPEGLNLREKRPPLLQEEWVVKHRLPAAAAFVRANGLDQVAIDAPVRTLGIVAAGKAYLDTRQALLDLGLTDSRCRELGIRVYKPGMIWPLEREGAVAFAEGSCAVLVVEEKRSVIEDQLARQLYAIPAQRRPDLAGKQDLQGAPLLSEIGELSPAQVRRAIARVLQQLGVNNPAIAERDRWFDEVERSNATAASSATVRPPFYCSGCPHNTSTRIPEGSTAISAVGCHGLAAYVMPERRTMQPMGMGADGMPWVSVGPLVDMPHVFQNMGDGTYSHSGVLSIRAAVAAKANITFKLLYNDAVAMTGGQPVEADVSPIDMVRQLVAEKVSPVVLVSDQPEKYDTDDLPAGVQLKHRDEMDALQRTLRESKGVSAIVYEQTCATEKRRRRKRGTYPDPDKRVFINESVCEGCGDCSVQSNCVSVQPLETEFGRKRTIDQSTCNKDFSCIKGFCPSFVTVTGAKIAKKQVAADPRLPKLLATLPQPASQFDKDVFNLLVAGIGGTGVLTVGALLGMAAHLEGKGCSILDMTGMAQKGGAVTSHIRIGRKPSDLFSARLDAGKTDVILACDLIVGAGADVMKTANPGVTQAVANLDVTPTGAFQTDRDHRIDVDALHAAMTQGLRGGQLHTLHGSRLATELTGDSIATNVLILGYAVQKGLVPLSVASIEEAIRLNGTQVESNLRTFALGRLAAHTPKTFDAEPRADKVTQLSTLQSVLDSRVKLLTAYQNATYAERYRSFVQALDQRVHAKGLARGAVFVREVALTLSRLMAYKDEYEVARLHSDRSFREQLDAQFAGDFKIRFHLAPPMLPGRDPHNGRPLKREFGPWILPVLRGLAGFKGLRGTPFDPFGYTDERRMERALITRYQALISNIVDKLTPNNLQTAIDLARAPAEIRGYGPVKHAAYEAYIQREADLLAALNAPPVAASTPNEQPIVFAARC